MTHTLFYSTLMATLIILLTPLMNHYATNKTTATQAVKAACIMSLIPTALFINSGLEATTTNFTWATMTFDIKVSLTFDPYAILFLPIALFITWAILEFAQWYMASDPAHMKFSKYLLLFLLAMLTLTSANNMLQLFVGWEAVGVMSFLLINWWHCRTNAATSALQAVIYNRLGDIGLILSMAWMATHINTWDLQQLLSHPTTPLLPLLGLILAAMGKSAQFGLHPWLPAAMEGPTPVSALLHSSTMVVAGIFLLVRFHPLLEPNPHAITTCLCLGATTTAFAALCAITQNDIKKIIAFSTSSQLGLMMLTVGLNQPTLAFLHITTHAFFKAMLFICSGSIIHNLANEQDIRKMGGVQQTLPITTACITLGSLALAGTPFLAGFFTKDLIIETMNNSTLNAWALTTTLLATALTAAYSLRLIYHVQLGAPRYLTTTRPTEGRPQQTRPMVRLAWGSITAGLIMSGILLPMKPQTMTMPPLIKLAALLTTALGLLSALDLITNTTHLTTPKSAVTHTTLSQLAFFNIKTHRHAPLTTLQTGHTSLHLTDLLWYETLGPRMIKNANLTLANKITSSHTGSIKTYLTTFVALLTSYLLWATTYGTR